MVRPMRFERMAFCFGGKRSIQLSYGRVMFFRIQGLPDISNLQNNPAVKKCNAR